MVGFSQQSNKGKSTFEVKQLPGVFDLPASDKTRQIAEQTNTILDQVLANTNLASSPTFKPFAPTNPGTLLQKLSSELTNPSFTPTSSSEQALIDQLKNQTAGASALRGLGSPTASGLATAIAPALVDLRNKRIANLAIGAGAQQAQTGLQLNQEQTDLLRQQLLQKAFIDKLSAIITGKFQNVDFGQSRIVAGNNSSRSGSGFGFGVGSRG